MTREPTRNRPPTPRLWRLALLGCGWLLIAAAPVVGLLPGPGGIFLAAAGAAVLLRHSIWAKRRYARARRRWPAWGDRLDRMMRRPSVRRRARLAGK